MAEPTEHLIEVRPDGSLHFLYDDALVGLMDVGPAQACRVSHVEPTTVDDRVVWYANMSPVNGPNFGPFDTREEALRAEREWLNANHLPDPKR